MKYYTVLFFVSTTTLSQLIEIFVAVNFKTKIGKKKSWLDPSSLAILSPVSTAA